MGSPEKPVLVSVPPEAAAETGLGYQCFVQEVIPGDSHCIDHVDLYVVSSTVLLSPSNVAKVPLLANSNLEPRGEAILENWLPSLRELNPPQMVHPRSLCQLLGSFSPERGSWAPWLSLR